VWVNKKNHAYSRGVAALLGFIMRSFNASESSMITALLDSNKNGSVVDDVEGMLLNGNKKTAVNCRVVYWDNSSAYIP
jgi:hypothetical protein